MWPFRLKLSPKVNFGNYRGSWIVGTNSLHHWKLILSVNCCVISDIDRISAVGSFLFWVGWGD